MKLFSLIIILCSFSSAALAAQTNVTQAEAKGCNLLEKVGKPTTVGATIPTGPSDSTDSPFAKQ